MRYEYRDDRPWFRSRSKTGTMKMIGKGGGLIEGLFWRRVGVDHKAIGGFEES